MVRYMSDIQNTEALRDIPGGEMKFYRILEVLSDDWLAWFSCEWFFQDQVSISFSEADFLLFNKDHGFAVIEIKGGNITNDNSGNWYTNENRLRKSPFSQAKNSMFFFRNNYCNAAKLKRKEDSLLLKKNNRVYLFPLKYLFLVGFPDCKYKKSIDIIQAGVNQEFIFDEEDLEENKKWRESGGIGKPPLEKWLLSQFSKFKKFNHGLSLKSINEFFINTISNAVKTKISLNTWLKNKEKGLKHINKEQDRIIKLFKYKTKAAFFGSAGTGKTFIAIKKIIYEFKYNSKVNVLYLCFNRALKGYIKEVLLEQINLYKIKVTKNHRATIRNIDNFISQIIRDYEDKIDSVDHSAYITASNTSNTKQVVKIFKDVLTYEKFKHKYDFILIDEAQDFPIEYFNFVKFLLKDSERSGLWIFYDNSQTIFRNDIKSISLDVMGLNTDHDKFFLSVNLRNTENIVNWFTEETDHGYYSEILSKSKQKIQIIETNTFSSAIDEAIKKIKELKKIFINLNRVVILGQYKFSYLYDNKISESTLMIKQNNVAHFKSYEISRNEYIISEPNKAFFNKFETPNNYYKKYNRIYYSGIGSFKGLESDIIILILNKRFNSENRKNKKRIYVGASRAKFLLYIINFDETL